MGEELDYHQVPRGALDVVTDFMDFTHLSKFSFLGDGYQSFLDSGDSVHSPHFLHISIFFRFRVVTTLGARVGVPGRLQRLRRLHAIFATRNSRLRGDGWGTDSVGVPDYRPTVVDSLTAHAH